MTWRGQLHFQALIYLGPCLTMLFSMPWCIFFHLVSVLLNPVATCRVGSYSSSYCTISCCPANLPMVQITPMVRWQFHQPHSGGGDLPCDPQAAQWRCNNVSILPTLENIDVTILLPPRQTQAAAAAAPTNLLLPHMYHYNDLTGKTII